MTYKNKVEELIIQNSILQTRNDRLEGDIAVRDDIIRDLNKQVKALKDVHYFAKIKELGNDIEKYKAILEDPDIGCYFKDDWVMKYVEVALREKLERLELEKARLRTEG